MNIFRKKISLLAALVLIFTMQSCSWMSKRKVLFGSEAANSKPNLASDTAKPNTQTVSKAQYDQLLGKYETLLDKIKKAETSSVSIQSNPSRVKGDAETQLDMINEISKINPPADLAETVDVFGANGISNQQQKAPVKKTMSDRDIESQLTMLQKANRLVSSNKMDSALIILKDLEESPNKQVAVRAKFYLAEMLFRQNEYDLAMQMYEEIVRKNAFSGLVIKSLGRLIVCSEKLKLGKKQERYYSILHDFFDA